jgi:adenine deaminase
VAACDRLIRGATVVNVYSGELLPGNVAISGGRIVYVGPNEPASAEVLEAKGMYVAPAWIEPHAHPWLLYNPVSLIEGVLPGGTTTLFNDDLFFYQQTGPEGFARILDALAGLPVRYRWLVRLMSQSEYVGEEQEFALERLKPLLARAEVAGSAELTRWPLVWKQNPCVLESIAYVHSLGKRVDGHTAGASYEKLNGVAAGGVDACHEAITKQEVLDRVRLGIWTILRHSSLRPDIPELARAVVEDGVDMRRIMLTVDGPAPRFIAEKGFVDEALRQCVAAGIDPVKAIQMATINPATYYGLDRELGGIAPGRSADVVILPDLREFRPVRVMMAGKDVAREGRASVELPGIDWDKLGLRRSFTARDLPLEVHQPIPVIEFVSNAITRNAGLQAKPEAGDILGVLADRKGRWATRAWIRNLAPELDGLASSYNTAMHLLVLGRDPAAMRRAAEAVAESDGGIATGDGWHVKLPVAGMMMDAPFAKAVLAQAELEEKVHSTGFFYQDILYSLLFLCCDFLPGIRLTPKGVFDVKSGAYLGA